MPSSLDPHQREREEQPSLPSESTTTSSPPTASSLTSTIKLDRNIENLKKLDASTPPLLHSPTPSRNVPTDYMGVKLSTQSERSSANCADQGSSRSGSPLEEYQVPPSLLSPAFTPPTTPGTPSLVGHAAVSKGKPKLMKELPEVTCVVRARIPTTTGTEVFLHLYQNNIDNKEHLAIVFGENIRSKSLDAPRPGETEMDRMIRGAYEGRLYPGRTTSRGPTTPTSETRGPPSPLRHSSSAGMDFSQIMSTPLVRIHSECYTGETAWSARCDCGEQLDEAARLMSQDPAGGVVVYLRQEGRGIGLGEKLKAYNLQDLGNDTVQANLILRHPADARSYGLATAILQDLECTQIRLLTNNPDKIAAVEGPNKEVKVVRRVGMVPKMWRGIKGGVEGREVSEYLRTKITKMGHLLDESFVSTEEKEVVSIGSGNSDKGNPVEVFDEKFENKDAST